ncbi:MAG: hypothetical protein COX02_01610 [Candidatus Vogelbacteria bacterium CG22_combo_CG10-13_8_21_14_all_37_9]|uniref:Sphingomyelin synthase-like domain-containing protein n=1 Tax=Candidatus Vogelbacteria bacterium CG22_combo_CG10-13_8_21_14_all_37_9 TaxID=1975046 RepID=A0A2H0BKQ4_9BACT|nr:MAG: hypothetical protein COX02_01610 [Candidatus Vogelbacteria bacterium CG22_combo_CG10-13_8_21_14_all_37_9]
MKTLTQKYRRLFSNRQFVSSLLSGVLLLIISFIINFYAGIYATEKISNPVTDIILDNIPVFNVDLLFIYGPLLLWTVVSLIAFSEPKRIPFILKNIALFVLIRSVFITLTHIGPFPDRIDVNYSLRAVKNFTFGGDLFFSAHTGLPFLMALVFWQKKTIRFLFIAIAILFGIVVLMGHLHYSIDVLAAFFITYTIYHLAKIFFAKDEN